MITYSSENIPFPKIPRRETTAWIRQVAQLHGYKVGDVGYLFCNDEKILEVNNEFLGHDYYTDIITFDYDEGNTINGDIVISLACHNTRNTAPLRHQRQRSGRKRNHGKRRK